MEIKDNGLRKLVENSLGLNCISMSQQKLLAATNVNGAENGTNHSALAKIDPNLNFRAIHRLATEVINEQKNFEDVVEKADDILLQEPRVRQNEEDVDQGWMTYFIEGAGKTYNERLKEYWAKLLAGEIKNPGSNSSRLIDFLKKLSVKDAERIQKMCKYVVCFKGNPKLLHYENEPYGFEEIRFLVELGLLDPSHDIILPYGSENSDQTLYLQRDDISFHITTKHQKHKVGIYSFTEVGNEFFRIIDDGQVDVNFLRSYSNYMNRKKSYLVFTCGKGEIQQGGFIVIPKDKQLFRIPEEI